MVCVCVCVLVCARLCVSVCAWQQRVILVSCTIAGDVCVEDVGCGDHCLCGWRECNEYVFVFVHVCVCVPRCLCMCVFMLFKAGELSEMNNTVRVMSRLWVLGNEQHAVRWSALTHQSEPPSVLTLFIYNYTHTHTLTRTHRHTHTHTLTHTDTHTQIYVQTTINTHCEHTQANTHHNV